MIDLFNIQKQTLFYTSKTAILQNILEEARKQHRAHNISIGDPFSIVVNERYERMKAKRIAEEFKSRFFLTSKEAANVFGATKTFYGSAKELKKAFAESIDQQLINYSFEISKQTQLTVVEALSILKYSKDYSTDCKRVVKLALLGIQQEQIESCIKTLNR